jgi:hypothetical protein
LHGQGHAGVAHEGQTEELLPSRLERPVQPQAHAGPLSTPPPQGSKPAALHPVLPPGQGLHPGAAQNSEQSDEPEPIAAPIDLRAETTLLERALLAMQRPQSVSLPSAQQQSARPEKA